MKKLSILFLVFLSLLICQSSRLNAQGVGINPSGNSPDPSAALDIDFANKGILITRMTTAERDAIVSPAQGLAIYNTDCQTFNYNAGTPSAPEWVTINSSNTLIADVSISASPVGAVCAGTSVTFTALPASGMVSPTYQWKLNGDDVGTNSPYYLTSSLNNGDVVTCILSSTQPCVTGSPATSNSITMIVNPVPSAPGSISGTTSVCADDADKVYSISPVANAVTYNWTVPAGATITAGAGTSSITVTFGSSSGNISVSAGNSCGTSSAGSQAITVTSAPATPGAITGSTSLCSSSAGNVYSITPVSGATGYTWNVPAGASITAGQNSTAITVTFGSSSGNVSVTANNSCGTSSAGSQAITVSSTPATPGTISGGASVCSNSSGNGYSISAVSEATTYTWSAPSGATITAGQNTSSILVTFGSTSGDISVTAGNACGTSSANTLAVTLIGGSGSQTFNTTNSGFSTSGSVQTFTVPACVTSISIDVYGAQGGSATNYGPGGKGARMKGQFTVSPGDVLNILVGNQGQTVSSYDGGGGGGSFVWKQSDSSLLIASGGGGGAGGGNCNGATCPGLDGVTSNNGTNGNSAGSGGGTGGNGGTLPGGTWSAGGAGWLTNGSNGNDCSPQAGGGVRPLAGGTGGNCGGNCSNNGSGGFGGGGGAQGGCNCTGGGGGGGYSGGGPATNCYGGGGGGSYNSGTSLEATAGFQSGNGQVIIAW